VTGLNLYIGKTKTDEGQTCDKLVADGSNRYGELAQSAVTALQACHYILVQACALFRLWTGRRPELRPIAKKKKEKNFQTADPVFGLTLSLNTTGHRAQVLCSV
jgi:hypothetical protein